MIILIAGASHTGKTALAQKSEPYQAEEGCLSLSGIRKAKRWKSIDEVQNI